MLALGALGALDLWRDTRHDGSTLSEITREVFHVHQPVGRCIFLVAWSLFSAGFAKHIVRPASAQPPSCVAT